jgi:phosphotransferase system enzyme I (PtsI)
LTGIKNIDELVGTDSKMIIDGFKGLLVIDPSDETLESYRQELIDITPIETIDEMDRSERDALETKDGRSINILANIDIAATYPKAKRDGANGIGLYRSEYLFNQYSGLPDEEEQYTEYCAIADQAGIDGVKIRLFDIAQNEFSGRETQREVNPALGMRGVRLSLTHEIIFREQVRAILRASYGRRIDILLPMVTNIQDVRKAKELIEHERTALSAAAVKIDDIRLGIMIEIPAAVMIIDELLEECDYIALGTNDLVQYLLAVDRDNEMAANWFQTLHPAVIRSIKMVIDAADKSQKPLVVCGEMAGSLFYLPLLIGLGADSLSMNVNSIKNIRRIVAGISYKETRILAEKVMKCRTSNEIEEILRSYISVNALNLYPKNFLNSAFS